MSTDGPELERTRAFFGPRAAGWEGRFPDDGPAYQRAVDDLGLRGGDRALDAGCGTGRAVDALRAAVGASGTVLAVDVTTEMLAEARLLGRQQRAALILADARRLPLPAGSVDGVLAAGLLPHVADARSALLELARVTSGGGCLAIFHPIGRQALAARHGHELRPDDVRARGNLEPLLESAGWTLTELDDGADRYLALARRRAPSG